MKGLRILATAWLVGLASTALVADGGQVAQVNSADAEFKVFCGACHGAGGKGDGPAAKSFRRRPADLTQLSKRNDGSFPADRVFNVIDGRTPVSGHGGPDMPVWGDVFARSRDSQSPEDVKARIEALVKYVETIQEKP